MNIDKNLMVFESNPDFSDNPRGLWEYVVKNTNYKTFWIIRDAKMLEILNKIGVDCAIEGSELAEQMIAKARFLISASFEFAYNKHPEQIHISAWHGFPLKLIGFFDSATQYPKSYEERLKIITTQSDIITAPSKLSQLTISGMFAMDPRKVKVTGYPRNDIMFTSDGKKELSKIVDIDVNNCKLIFYLPTMRKGLKKEGRQFNQNIFNYNDYNADILDEFLEKENAYIIAKVHFADNEHFSGESFKLPKRIIFINTEMLTENYLTIYHIMNAFDMLVTDYSSVYADFLLLDKPIVFSCPDLVEYKRDRGFIVDDPAVLMPGTIVQNQIQLLEKMKNIFSGEDEFDLIRKEKLSLFHSYNDSNSAKRLFEELMEADRGNIRDTTKWGYCFFEKHSPLFQYMKGVKAEIFFDTGKGFSEECKKIKEYRLTGESEEIIIEEILPSNVKGIRFDPDADGRCILKNLEIWLDGTITEYQTIRGEKIEDSIVFGNGDPQIIIPFNDRKYETIRIKFQGFDLYSEAGIYIEKLYNEQQLFEKELVKIRASYSYKLTKPFRCVTEVTKKILKKIKRSIMCKELDKRDAK